MQRSTTTSVLLVSTSVAVAVLTLSGCTGVERASGRGAVSAGPATPARAPSSRPPAVQAPARDALERGGPADTPSPTAPLRPKASPPRPSTTPPSPTDAAAAHERDKRHGHSASHRPAGSPQAPGPDAGKAPRPDAPPPALAEVDLCALGRTHGGWEPDSQEAAICRAAYGR
ncbi:hypothetical protein [Streptomyces flavofungini]|uniref:hypothetical protein n=1 Tax=Streptomyces flavofungini TaxID=68200 RepID=UPI0025AF953A|nr:hypothetical protein [Streptomyces flavofungini]WJV50181.1 hypothetical protein QUY26_34495 [Streptomyces flavofungini]